MAKALEFYRKEAEGGISRSLNQLGCFYENGYGGLDEDFDKAAEYYLQAAEKGNKSSQYHLGMYYSNVKHEDAEALKWFEKAAQKDHVNALVIAGNMYKNGRGTKIDYKKAFDYYTRAIELEDNNSYAQVALAHMYQQGFYVKRNLKGDGARDDARQALKEMK